VGDDRRVALYVNGGYDLSVVESDSVDFAYCVAVSKASTACEMNETRERLA
jgi:hypothetical protein